MLSVNLHSNLKEFTRGLDAFAEKQVPFASALALSNLAKLVQQAETDALSKELDRPTPFTQKAFGVIRATKASQTAVVFAKDIQARYLAPAELGTRQVVKKTALTMPIDIATNSYGNIPKGALQRLKGNPNVFIGKVQTKHGEIGGIWQRVGAGSIATRKTGAIPKGHVIPASAGGKGSLKLLVKFTEAVALKPVLHYRSRAATLIKANFEREMSKALAQALRTAA